MNGFDNKVEIIVQAIDSSNSLPALKQNIREIQKLMKQTNNPASLAKLNGALVEAREKSDDLTDAFKTLRGSGVEKATASLGLLRESIFNLDIDKFKIAIDGLGSSFKAFLGAAGVGALIMIIENYDKLIDRFSASAQAARENERALKDLSIQIDYQRVTIDRNVIALDSQLQSLISQEAPLQTIIDKIKEINNLKMEGYAGEIKKVDKDIDNLLEKIAEAKKDNENSTVTEGLLQFFGIDVGTTDTELKELYDKLAELQVKRGNLDNQREALAASTENSIAAIIKRARDQAEADRRKYNALVIENMHNQQAQELAVEQERYRIAVLDAKGNKAILEQEQIKHKQIMLDIDFKYDLKRKAEQKAQDDFELAELAKLNTKKEEIKEKGQNDSFLKTIKQGEAQLVYEDRLNQRTLQGKIDALDKERLAKLATVGDSESAANAKLEIEKEYQEKVDELKKKEIERDFNAAASIYGNAKQLAQELFALQSQLAEQELALLKHGFSESDRLRKEFYEEQNYQAELETRNIEQNLENRRKDELSNYRLTSKEKEKINADYDKQVQDLQRKAARDKIIRENQQAQTDYAIKKSQFDAEEELARANFEREKKFKIAVIAMEGIEAGAKLAYALAVHTGTLNPVGIAAAITAGAAVLATTATQIAAVAGTQFLGGTPPSPPVPQIPPVESGNVGGSAALEEASKGADTLRFNGPGTFFNSGEAGVNNAANQQSNASQRVYVLESDITDAQKKVSLAEQESTF